jgi:RNA polymerase sigma-70 factor (ECF subfamily)
MWAWIPSGERLAQSAVPDLSQIELDIMDLYQKHSSALFRYASTTTKDPAIIQDGIQEAFLRYYIKLRTGQQVDNPRAWLACVLRNYLIDWKRKSMASVELEAAENVKERGQDAASAYERKEALERILTYLSPRERECIQLRVAGFDYEEIARIMKIRPGTVAALLFRVLKKVQKKGLRSKKHS